MGFQKVNSGQAHAIQYEGIAFAASTKYTWTVQVWDNKGKVSKATSWFETGLLNTSESAWSGAQWIGGGDEDLVFTCIIFRYLNLVSASN